MYISISTRLSKYSRFSFTSSSYSPRFSPKFFYIKWMHVYDWDRSAPSRHHQTYTTSVWSDRNEYKMNYWKKSCNKTHEKDLQQQFCRIFFYSELQEQQNERRRARRKKEPNSLRQARKIFKVESWPRAFGKKLHHLLSASLTLPFFSRISDCAKMDIFFFIKRVIPQFPRKEV